MLDDDWRVLGIVTDRDLVVRALAEDMEPDTPVGKVMTRDVRVCHPNDSLRWAEEKMAAAKKSRLVVVDTDGRCVGIISLSNIARADTRARAGGVLYAVTLRETGGADTPDVH